MKSLWQSNPSGKQSSRSRVSDVNQKSLPIGLIDTGDAEASQATLRGRWLTFEKQEMQQPHYRLGSSEHDRHSSDYPMISRYSGKGLTRVIGLEKSQDEIDYVRSQSMENHPPVRSSPSRTKTPGKFARRLSGGNKNSAIRRKASKDQRDRNSSDRNSSDSPMRRRQSRTGHNPTLRNEQEALGVDQHIRPNAETNNNPGQKIILPQRKPMPPKRSKRTKTICIDTAKELLAVRTSPAVKVFEPSQQNSRSSNNDQGLQQKAKIFGVRRRNSAHGRAFGAGKSVPEKPRQQLSKISKEDLREWLEFSFAAINEAYDAVTIDLRSTLSSTASNKSEEGDSDDRKRSKLKLKPILTNPSMNSQRPAYDRVKAEPYDEAPGDYGGCFLCSTAA